MKQYYPYICIFSAFTIWSTVGIVVNKTVLTPFQMLWSSSLIASLVTLGILLINKKARPTHTLLDPFLIFLFISQGLFGIVWFQALTRSPIATASFISSLNPIFILLLAPILIKEKYNLKSYAAIGVGLIGLAFLLYNGHNIWENLFSLGNLFALLSGVLLATASIATKKVVNKYSLSFIVFIQMVAQVVFATPFILNQSLELNTVNLLYISYQGIIASALPFYLLTEGFKYLKTATVTTIGYIEPFLAALLGIFFLSQPITPFIIVGGILIIFSSYLINLSQDK